MANEIPEVGTSFLQHIQLSMPTWFQQGGIVMWLLLLASFLVTIVTLERGFTWILYYLQKERQSLNGCFSSLNNNDKTRALLFCQERATPAMLMLQHGIEALPFSPQQKMHSSRDKQLNIMSRGQFLLMTVITLAPALGILGSVFILIESFGLLSAQQNSSGAAIIGAIAHALVATAMGLSIALLALVPYNLFRALAKKLTLHLSAVESEFLHICQQKKLITKVAVEMPHRHHQAALTQQQKPLSLPLQFTEDATLQDEIEQQEEAEYAEEATFHEAEVEELEKKVSKESIVKMYTKAVDASNDYYETNESELKKPQTPNAQQNRATDQDPIASK